MLDIIILLHAYNSYTYTHLPARLHPMDCTDIILGSARGEQYRVYDYYTRDRGQPWKDDFYNGEDSITAAVGKEEDGYTYMKWRRLLTTGSYLIPLLIIEHTSEIFGLLDTLIK